MTPSAMKVSNLRVQFGAHVAVADASFEVSPGETLGLVGESGSGKSSLARAILRLLPAAGGTVEWRGRNLLDSSRAEMRALRRELQIVFQDPLASLDPRMSIGATVAEPLEIFEPDLSRMQRCSRVESMLEQVGLAAEMYARYPHEFSGGQCQRVGIARAMIVNPALLICDEPVSSLDVSIQGQIVNLLLDIRRDSGMSMLFISHNLAIVRHVSHRVLVLFKGELVVTATSAELFSAPAHPYTIELLRAATGTLGSDAASGSSAAAPGLAATGCCVFRDRCAYVLPLCRTVAPPLVELAPDHRAACHRAREIAVSDILRI